MHFQVITFVAFFIVDESRHKILRKIFWLRFAPKQKLRIRMAPMAIFCSDAAPDDVLWLRWVIKSFS